MPPVSSPSPRRLPVFLLRAAAPLGLVISLFLVAQYISYKTGRGVDSRFCFVGGVFNCEAVEASGYTAWFGIPIASLGVFYFLLLSAVGWWLSPGPDADARRRWQGMIASMTLPAVAFAWGLAMLSALAIQYLCLGCTAIYAVILACAVSPFWLEPRQYIHAMRSAPRELLALAGSALTSKGARRRRALLAGACLFLIGAANFAYPVWVVRRSPAPNPARAFWEQPAVNLLPPRTGLSEGDPDAPVQIIVFTDFACPYCAEFTGMIKPLLEERAGRYFLGYKHYPLSRECNPIMKEAPFDHPRACRLAQMAEVLAEWGEFKQWGSRLYLPSEADLYPPLKQLADDADIDYGTWVARSTNDAIRKNVQADIEEGLALGLRALPAVYINGRYVPTLSRVSIQTILGSIDSPEP